jgi:hypothetical protein
MTSEIWAQTKYPGYQVSTFGRAKGKRGSILSSSTNKAGYVTFVVNPEHKSVYVHHLVLETFVGPRPDGLEACHNDGNHGNNRLDNLRWDTRSSNFHDQVKHGVHVQARKTHCPRGHLLEDPNLLKKKQKGRTCLSCSRARAYAYQRTTKYGEVWTDHMFCRKADEYYSRLSIASSSPE